MTQENFEIAICPHPAQARHPFTKVPLVDDKGDPVPLFPDERCIKLDKQIIGYVGTKQGGRPVMLTKPESHLGSAIVAMVFEKVKEHFGSEYKGKGAIVPDPPKSKKKS